MHKHVQYVSAGGIYFVQVCCGGWLSASMCEGSKIQILDFSED